MPPGKRTPSTTEKVTRGAIPTLGLAKNLGAPMGPAGQLLGPLGLFNGMLNVTEGVMNMAYNAVTGQEDIVTASNAGQTAKGGLGMLGGMAGITGESALALGAGETLAGAMGASGLGVAGLLGGSLLGGMAIGNGINGAADSERARQAPNAVGGSHETYNEFWMDQGLDMNSWADRKGEAANEYLSQYGRAGELAGGLAEGVMDYGGGLAGGVVSVGGATFGKIADAGVAAGSAVWSAVTGW